MVVYLKYRLDMGWSFESIRYPLMGGVEQEQWVDFLTLIQYLTLGD